MIEYIIWGIFFVLGIVFVCCVLHYLWENEKENKND